MHELATAGDPEDTGFRYEHWILRVRCVLRGGGRGEFG
jgi:hypothetical protein